MGQQEMHRGLPALLGGAAACDFAWPSWPVHDETEKRLLWEVLESGQWWFGERVREFERRYAEFQGARFAVSCTNGTAALEMGLRALGVVDGDEVIVPAYSFIATASAVVTIGAVPIFADIDPHTLCLDVADAARKVTPRTRAIVPVHVAGRIADMDAIQALACRHQLQVLEDAAHAWGSRVAGGGAGLLSRAGTFSFQVSKNITSGEGGLLVTNEEEVAALCRSYSHCGRTSGSAWYDHPLIGSNLRLTEFQAAVLLAQLSRLPEQVARREGSARLLDQALADIPGVQLLAPAPEMVRRSHHIYIFRWRESEAGLTRAALLRALQAEGVPASEGWYRPLYRNEVFQNAHLGPRHLIRFPLAGSGADYRNVACPVCEQVCQDAVWLPQYVLLAEEAKLQALADAVRKVVRHAAQLSAG